MTTFGNTALLGAPYQVAFDWDAGMDDILFRAMEDAIADKLARCTDQLVFVSGSSHFRSSASVAAKRHAEKRIVVTPTIQQEGRVCTYDKDFERVYIDAAREPVPAARIWDPLIDPRRELLVKGSAGETGHRRALRLANVRIQFAYNDSRDLCALTAGVKFGRLIRVENFADALLGELG